MNRTNEYSGLIAETVGVAGHGGAPIRAYVADTILTALARGREYETAPAQS
jgi:hypothetical protein